MIPALAFFSGLGAISENSNYFSKAVPNLTDYDTWNICSIVSTFGTDITGATVPTFQMLYTEKKKKWNTVIQFPRPDANGQATIAGLKTWYDTNTPGNQLVLFTNLICIDKINQMKPNILGNYTSVLLNDTFIMRRTYDPTWVQPDTSPEFPTITPATHIQVYQGNEADYKFYTVLGDQTFAGNGYYGT